MGGTPRGRNQVRKAAVVKRRELDEPFKCLKSNLERLRAAIKRFPGLEM